MNIPSNILTLLAGIVLTLVSLWYGQNNNLLPIAASDEAALVDGLFNAMLTVGIGIFLMVEGVLIFCLFKFRRQPGDQTDGPPIEGNIPLEIVWTAIPAVIVLIISIYSFDIYKAMGGFDPDAANDPGVTQVAMVADGTTVTPLMEGHSHLKPAHHHMALGIGAFPEDEGRPADVNVDVMGLQYAWIFTYPQGVTTGELHIPVDQEIRLTIKAQDVLHAFWLPELRLKQDAIPGREAELRFRPRKTGEYPIVCAELCGPYHGAMSSKMIVHTAEDYNTWLNEQIAAVDDPTQAVAVVPAGDRPDADYLATFAGELGVDSALLEQLHPAQALSDSVAFSLPAP